MRLISVLQKDLARLGGRGAFDALKWYFVPRGECFPYVFWLRLLQYVRNHQILRYTIGIPVYCIYRHFEFKYGTHANANIEIGEGLRIVHGPCNLNAARIGKNFTVYSGVTIGCNKGAIPNIGDNVSIYSNAVVVGGIDIGNNVVIGALSYVGHSLEDGVRYIPKKNEATN